MLIGLFSAICLLWKSKHAHKALEKCLKQVETPFLVFLVVLKKLEGHIAFGLSVCLSVCASVNFLTVNATVLKFHMHIPHEKIVDPYFFSCPSYAPFQSYCPLKT